MFPKVVTILPAARQVAARNYGISAVVFQKAAAAKVDPIQKLFLDKSKEYYTKKAASKSGLVDPSPEMQKSLKDEIEKVTKSYGTSATTEFPTFKFSEPVLEPIDGDKLEIKA